MTLRFAIIIVISLICIDHGLDAYMDAHPIKMPPAPHYARMVDPILGAK